MKQILIAVDAFKGCLSSIEINQCVSEAIQKCYPTIQTISLPISDGGEGFLTAMERVFSLERVQVKVHDPLMRPIQAEYGWSQKLAVIEMAKASGIHLVSEQERDIIKATTYGTGELLADAMRRGTQKILLGLGGSATCDGGRGAIEALKTNDLLHQTIDLDLYCDVNNPMCGKEGAAYVFSPQKGANQNQVQQLELILQEWAIHLEMKTGKKVANLRGGGAAGGIAAGLYAYLNARICSGIENFLDLVQFEELAHQSDLIITGEGSLDAQSLRGKAPFGVLKKAGNVPVIAMAGQIKDVKLLLKAGFAEVRNINLEPLVLKEAMHPLIAQKRIRKTTLEIVKKYK